LLDDSASANSNDVKRLLALSGVAEDLQSIDALREGSLLHAKAVIERHMTERRAVVEGKQTRGQSLESCLKRFASEEIDIRYQFARLRLPPFDELFSPSMRDRELAAALFAAMKTASGSDDRVAESFQKLLISPHAEADVDGWIAWLDGQPASINEAIWPYLLLDPVVGNMQSILTSKGFQSAIGRVYPHLFRSTAIENRQELLQVLSAAPNDAALNAGLMDCSPSFRVAALARDLVTDDTVALRFREAALRLLPGSSRDRALGKTLLNMAASETSDRLKIVLLEVSSLPGPLWLVDIGDVAKVAEAADTSPTVRAAAQSLLDRRNGRARVQQQSAVERTRASYEQVMADPARERDAASLTKIEAFNVDETIKASARYSAALSAWAWQRRTVMAELELLYALIEDYGRAHEGEAPRSLDVLQLPAGIDPSRFRYHPVKRMASVGPSVILVTTRDALLFLGGTRIYVQEGNINNPEKVYDMEISRIRRLVEQGNVKSVPFRSAREMQDMAPKLFCVLRNGAVVELTKSRTVKYVEANNMARSQTRDPLVSADEILAAFRGADEDIYRFGWTAVQDRGIAEDAPKDAGALE
jgi:hypothetical protein